jgi:hypothetical protein
MSIVTVKPGVEFKVIAPGGFAILAAIQQAAEVTTIPLVITSACDGEHSGPNDPHHRGEAYDVRTHDMSTTDKHFILGVVLGLLGQEKFFGFLEDPGTENEHIHFQVRKGTTYP